MMKLEGIKLALRVAKQTAEVEHPTQTLRSTEAAAKEKLVQCVQSQQPIAIAVNGGVDSLTLATLLRILKLSQFYNLSENPRYPARL